MVDTWIQTPNWRRFDSGEGSVVELTNPIPCTFSPFPPLPFLYRDLENMLGRGVGGGQRGREGLVCYFGPVGLPRGMKREEGRE